MNDRINWASEIAVASLEGDEQWQAVRAVLTSALFAKAPRMCGLFSFLMIRKLTGMAETINEHAIGVEVFRRDARDFDTTIDPVVRVQMGRLRERLAQYHAAARPHAFHIAIPAGSYVPVVSVSQAQAAALRPVHLAPLRTLSADNDAAMFVSGLEEELAQQLAQRFGNPFAGTPAQGYDVQVSVRVECLHARASIRLVDKEQVLWLHQCDRHGSLGIALQEKLALAICDDLSGFMRGNPPAFSDRLA
jgi:TolB-like protein